MASVLGPDKLKPLVQIPDKFGAKFRRSNTVLSATMSFRVLHDTFDLIVSVSRCLPHTCPQCTGQGLALHQQPVSLHTLNKRDSLTKNPWSNLHNEMTALFDLDVRRILRSSPDVMSGIYSLVSILIINKKTRIGRVSGLTGYSPCRPIPNATQYSGRESAAVPRLLLEAFVQRRQLLPVIQAMRGPGKHAR